MPKYECVIMEPTGSVESDVKQLVEVFPPIFDEFWTARGKDYYRVERAQIDITLLAQTWASRVTRLILVKDEGAVVGFLMGSSIPPFFHLDRMFQVEAVYGRTPEAEQALLDYIALGFAFFPDRFLSLPDYCGGLSGLKHAGCRSFMLYER
jgi:hypothetical protein